MAGVSGLQTFKPTDPFFEDGDFFCEVNTKEPDCSQLSSAVVESTDLLLAEVNCRHCSKVFPSTRLAEMHLLESHDELFRMMASKRPMYECAVEGCARKFSTPEDRKDHLIRQHSFPSNYRFVSMPPGKRPSNNKPADNVPEDVSRVEGMDVGQQSSSNASPKLPTSITFGRGRGRGRGRGKSSQSHTCSKAPVDVGDPRMD